MGPGTPSEKDKIASAWHPHFGFSDVERFANNGSFQKARLLLKADAVKVLIRCADGAVEVSVASETSNKVYDVRVPPPTGDSLAARCTCVDFKSRGGLCKHGAAAIMYLMHEGVPTCAPTFELATPRISEAARAWSAERRPYRGPPLAKRARFDCATAVGSPNGRETQTSAAWVWLPETPPPPALPQPRFPRASAPGSSESPKKDAAEASQRRSSVKMLMLDRLLRAHAAAGNFSGFETELHRWGDSPLQAPEQLLHAALRGKDEEGAIRVVTRLLQRNEMIAQIDTKDSTGLTPLASATVAGRLSMCKLLVEHGADLQTQDAAGRTPLDIARKRRLDTSLRQLEDPFVELLRR